MAAVLFLAVAAVAAGCGGSAETRNPSEAPESSSAEQPQPAADAADAAADAAAQDAQAANPPASDSAAGEVEFRPETATGAVPGVPAETNTAPIVAVANYFTELPGLDVAALKPRQREKFLQHVNSEMCPCGCKNDTLARCYVNDPRCPVVRGMVQKIYDEVKAGK
jgi:hypothetical protein